MAKGKHAPVKGAVKDKVGSAEFFLLVNSMFWIRIRMDLHLLWSSGSDPDSKAKIES
jgi:hypothetical protein